MKFKKIYLVLPLMALLVSTIGFLAIKSGLINANAMTLGGSNTFFYSLAPDIEKINSKPTFFEGFDSGWSDGAYKRKWMIATWMQNGTQMGKARAKENQAGFLTQTVLPEEPFKGGSIQTKKEFGYGRWVGRLKPSNVPGVLNSFFTIDWDNHKTPAKHDGTKFEVDIEFLTHTFGPNSGKVHLAIHVEGHKNYYEVDIPLRFNPSDKFHNWGFDILHDRVVWHVDGKVLHTWMAEKPNMIPDNYEFFINSWTSKNWVKGPPKREANYYVDWVKFTPIKP